MSLLAVLFPLYLLGNLHCFSMCGPLVFTLGQHRFRYLYLLGRLTSFTLAGLIAGGLGAIITLSLNQWHLSALLSFTCGALMILFSLSLFKNKAWFQAEKWQKLIAPLHSQMTRWMLADKWWTTFLFGFLTIALPCGQTLLVFSQCALWGSWSAGLLNGFTFALLTSPALFLALNANSLLSQLKNYYDVLMGGGALLAGFLCLLRGCAQWGWISHLTLNEQYHIVLF